MKRRNLPPLGPLVSFCAAAEHQSFTKAAQELNLTHGAISRAVQQLEQHFEQPLFYRRSRRVYLTEKGQLLANQASIMLKDLEAVSEQIRQQPSGQHLAVSCEPSLAMRWLMPRLTQFSDTTEVHLSTAGGPVDLAAQQLDLAIRRSDFNWPDDYWVTPLTRERIGPVCHPDYLSTMQQQKATLLHTRTRPSAWKDWQDKSEAFIVSQKESYFDHFYFSLQAAVAGLGMTIGAEPLVADDIRMGHLVAPFGFVETDVEYVALSLKDIQRDDTLLSFVHWLKEALNNS
ncbi:LysR family transcriptional regulator [Oceanospirillum sediminis]|uniref:LysR family transcriptional regulator n=1 Tax=Oceanospirillum sediminis TaxID=2760088 RepID=A0A839IW26_9GAMM|nr:LysR family transcriptional regulator [Oceanospirillum sediminis]MBB1488962.1 LysR family transcriptional regulator [Oceanospirillum sediminis]